MNNSFKILHKLSENNEQAELFSKDLNFDKIESEDSFKNLYALTEAISLSQYKDVVKDSKIGKEYQDRYKDLFSKYSHDKNAYRIYFDLKPEESEEKLKPPSEINRFLFNKSIELVDYKKGLVKDKYGREVKLGKVLKENPELLKKFNEDPQRTASKDQKYKVVISRHPYDIAGMSTGRGWTSCMNLEHGENREFVPMDIHEGSLVAYVIKSTDTNITHPVGRYIIKPYLKKYSNDKIFKVDPTSYGTKIPGDLKVINSWLDDANKDKELGKYTLNQNLYQWDLPTHVYNFSKNPKDSVKNLNVLFKDIGVNVEYKETPDGTEINVNDNLEFKYIDELPPGINNVSGDFNCSRNFKLKSLEGAPESVGGDFNCSRNDFKSLEGAPESVGGYFNCSYTKIKSLEGAPKTVGGDFNCSYTEIKSLKGAPESVGRDFNCSRNFKLKSLEGAPESVSEDFNCSYTEIKSLKGLSKKIGRDFNCSRNFKLKSLEGAPESVGGDFNCSYTKIKSLEGLPKKIGGELILSESLDGVYSEKEIRAMSDVKGKISGCKLNPDKKVEPKSETIEKPMESEAKKYESMEDFIKNLNSGLKKWGWKKDSPAYKAVNNPKNLLDSLLGEHEIIEKLFIDKLGYDKAHELANKEIIKKIRNSNLLQDDYTDKQIINGISAIHDVMHKIGNDTIDDKIYKPSGMAKHVFNNLLNGVYEKPTYSSLEEFYNNVINKEKSKESKELPKPETSVKEIPKDNNAKTETSTKENPKSEPPKKGEPTEEPWQQNISDIIDRNVFKETVSPSIQKDGQKVIDAAIKGDIDVLNNILSKYIRDKGIDENGSGVGPKKAKKPRTGAVAVWNAAQRAKENLTKEIQIEPKDKEINKKQDSNSTSQLYMDEPVNIVAYFIKEGAGNYKLARQKFTSWMNSTNKLFKDPNKRKYQPNVQKAREIITKYIEAKTGTQNGQKSNTGFKNIFKSNQTNNSNK